MQFLLAGLNLPTSELARAAANVRLHALIQSFNLLVIPLGMLLTCSALSAAGWLAPALRDGMLVMSVLPTTVNMCVALTRSSEGNEALAIFYAVLGNLLGVLFTPGLLLLLVGRTGAISVGVSRRRVRSSNAAPMRPWPRAVEQPQPVPVPAMW